MTKTHKKILRVLVNHGRLIYDWIGARYYLKSEENGVTTNETVRWDQALKFDIKYWCEKLPYDGRLHDRYKLKPDKAVEALNVL